MTAARPFRAVRYDTSRVDLSRVIVPPYDVVAADEREAFFDRDPHNAIRFELTRDVRDEAAADYTEIKSTLDEWLESGVLLQDRRPGYYVMRQRFVAPGGEPLERIGFFAELGLAEYDERIVRPHERTLAGPKADRLKLLRATRANLSPVFLLYQDREQSLTELLAAAFEPGRGGELLGSARDEQGIEYTLARLVDADAVATLRQFMEDRPSVIADGHHRYETALEYRRQQARAVEAAHQASPEKAPWDSTLAYFANAYAPGSLLLPIHRVIRSVSAPTETEWLERLPGWSRKTVVLGGEADVERALAENLAPLAGTAAFAADAGDGSLAIFVREAPLGDDLMVRVLEREVIAQVFGLSVDDIRGGAVSFPKSAGRAAREVRDGHGTVALYLEPLAPDDVFRVTAAGEVMPQKSTFFFPKIPTGLVFRLHSQDDHIHDRDDLHDGEGGAAAEEPAP